MGRHKTSGEIEMPPTNKLMLTVLEASAVSGLSRTTMYGLVRGRTIPSKRVGKRWLIRRTDLDQFMLPDAPP